MPQHEQASSVTTSPHPGGVASHAHMAAEAPSPTEAPRAAPKENPMPIAPKCPGCHGETKPYQGDNPHKAGSYECRACGLRVRPE